ncbi:Isopentenyl-diphosphate Delta-isomerase II, chloroplastic [Galdieria sulphuraria]|uniref:isopentenyl-diphosphate Delta-isomerase n=1 Tax=Galdieria sulphuraria TaxID=130081 RepID=M2XCF5_GALSU|nr:isopentenyl-diphosphate delta-isomerase [Galdieria sulphuraria]EME27612.1 isopentenyl-diphosphate delta-isomerase [Galdieria sulphuraria]GJD09805.1 Isopentenyl-diphosphate Delta-isomerase II, chloroplastic [Galdieria sulphuraria]|eukprot:XP_005704132.1 isopentenyl-diphosphate delta-isomerase [Galdieria sulphuraria]
MNQPHFRSFASLLSTVVSRRLSRLFMTQSTGIGSVTSNVEKDLKGADEEQRELMAEQVILVSPDDEVQGFASKAEAHHVSSGLLLHRAFSVFLFDSHKRLLLQQRANTKITFPLYWTNTCCSHPLYNIKEELSSDADGVKHAAKRKLYQELGISPETLGLEDFQYLTRIHYRAMSDTTWGEHEIDYILFLVKDVELNPCKNEVEAIHYVDMEQLQSWLTQAQSGSSHIQLTPWFMFIAEHFLFDWWKQLETDQLFRVTDKNHIYRATRSLLKD